MDRKIPISVLEISHFKNRLKRDHWKNNGKSKNNASLFEKDGVIIEIPDENTPDTREMLTEAVEKVIALRGEDYDIFMASFREGHRYIQDGIYTTVLMWRQDTLFERDFNRIIEMNIGKTLIRKFLEVDGWIFSKDRMTCHRSVGGERYIISFEELNYKDICCTAVDAFIAEQRKALASVMGRENRSNMNHGELARLLEGMILGWEMAWLLCFEEWEVKITSDGDLRCRYDTGLSVYETRLSEEASSEEHAEKLFNTYLAWKNVQILKKSNEK